jgi:malate dehydrogenase (oxaloacetate-decarboxylating)(NADP+)
MSDINLTEKRFEKESLDYHSMGRKGKIEVIPTKPFTTQKDLSYAYTPGVAYPCLEIEKDPHKAYDYTAKGNLVAVVSNGTAVLGLGNIGAVAGKPVMEGKGILFKKFADIDVFDIELDISDPQELVNVVKTMEPTFGGINLEDIKAPECFYVEEELKKIMKIPVFHDDQHGTAIISAAGILNGLELVGKKIGDVKFVIVGAGAAGISSANLYIKLGADPEKIYMLDTKGVLWYGRGDEDSNIYKKPFYRNTDARTLDDIIEGADIFTGFSVKGLLTKEMCKKMAPKPLIFAMANPNPEIKYEDAKEARPDAIVATGRSDYPNQINNVLGFPFIFRGAMDVEATTINDEMKIAMVYALANLAKEEVPEEVRKKYNNDFLTFGPDYIIPKPFDPRVLPNGATAVAEAAIKTGVARKILDIDKYRESLLAKIDWSRNMMRNILSLAGKTKKRIVFPEGENQKIIWAASEMVEENIATPVLLVKDKENTIELFKEMHHSINGIEFIEYLNCDKMDYIVDEYYKLRQRKGITRRKAILDMQDRYYFAAMMVKLGLADTSVGGAEAAYQFVLKPALEIIGPQKGVNQVVSGLHWIKDENRNYFIADTAVNISPSASDLVDIIRNSVEAIQRFGFVPKVALLSYSNFGSVRNPEIDKINEAIKTIKQIYPDLMIDGPMMPDFALDLERLHFLYPFTELKELPNLLVCPDLNSANISIGLIQKLSKAHVIGPIMEGFDKPVQMVTRTTSVRNIVNLASISCVDTLKG